MNAQRAKPFKFKFSQMAKILRRASLSLAGRPDCFRLLKILPGRNGDQIRCSLSVHAILSSAGNYETGSYVWGPKNDCREILVDGEPVQVRQRLWTFLRQLRRQDTTTEVWIDALCIKQDDANEKAQQIRLLSKIFQGARESISWLGETDKDIHQAFDIVEQRASQTRDLYRGCESSARRLTYSEWCAVNKLVEHEYFTRRWIVQEIMLPVSLTLQCGQRRLPFEALESFLSSLSHWESEERCLQVDQSIVRRLWGDRSKLHVHHGGLHLPDLLWRYKDTVCKKPCDKVNAFLGMVDNGHLLYCEDDLKKLYDRVVTSSDWKGFDLIAFGLFMGQELGLHFNSHSRIIVQVDKPLSARKTF